MIRGKVYRKFTVLRIACVHLLNLLLSSCISLLGNLFISKQNPPPQSFGWGASLDAYESSLIARGA